jgi:signal transduction histidine kinase/DNA-binding LacI/PurR family transcriptional regulator
VEKKMDYILNDKPLKKSKLTIGFLDENDRDDYHLYITEGVYEAAKKYDVNIVRFSNFTSDTIKDNSMIFNFIKQFDLDGLLFLGWSSILGKENFSDFKDRFDSIPLFSMGVKYDGIPSVYFDGGEYIKEMLLHLIDIHKFKKIAFIEPSWADKRGDIYKSIMVENGIYNPDLYICDRDISLNEVSSRGKKAVSILLDHRKVEVDAIVSLYTKETEDIINELKSRGISVPLDIAVTSYEDGETGRYFSPSFTTVYFPWKEMAFCACERFVELLRNGSVPLATTVPGRIIIRDSCGCMSRSVNLVNINTGDNRIGLQRHSIDEIKQLEDRIRKKIEHTALKLETLLYTFFMDLRNKRNEAFLNELQVQLRNPSLTEGFENVEDLASVLRNEIIPDISDIDELLLTEDMLLQAQLMMKEKALNIWGNRALQKKHLNKCLEYISHEILKHHTMDSLMDSLEDKLRDLHISRCYIFMFHSRSSQKDYFDNCSLVYEFLDNSRKNINNSKVCPVKSLLMERLFSEDRQYLLMSYWLYVNNEFIGFILYEPGPIDEQVYSTLSSHISTALSGAVLFEKLEQSYKKLIDNAHKEGMTNAANGMLHNISNVLNSINTSIFLMGDLIRASFIEDFLRANALLEKNIDNIEDFICNNVKGKKLMEFYTKLGEPLQKFQEEIINNLNRLDEKSNMINDILIAQQNYEGLKYMAEEVSIINILEDALKMNMATLEKNNIKIIKNYDKDSIVKIQRTKLLHVLMNIIKNAKEAMTDTPEEDRVLTLTVNSDASGVYIRIRDKGCGMSEDMLRSIFAYGFTTKLTGHGFGLHSCANYMTEMGGRLIAESQGEGRGATFILSFYINP